MNLNVKFSSAEEEMDVRFKENNASIPVEFGGMSTMRSQALTRIYATA